MSTKEIIIRIADIMPICAADTSPLIAFSSIERLDILRNIFNEVLIPQTVFEEVITQGKGWDAAKELQKAVLAKDWVYKTRVDSSVRLEKLRKRLGLTGEAEAIELAATKEVPVLLDELAGRRAAADLSVEVIGSLGILRRAKNIGIITSVAPLVRAMVQRGLYFDDKLIADFLKGIGENENFGGR